MRHIRLLLAVASALALAACAQTAPKSTFSVAPPSAAVNAVASPQSAGADLSTNTGGTYPYGQAIDTQTSNANAGASAGQDYPTVPGPDGAVWLKPDAANETYRMDADSCYSFARAQLDHDARIERDAGAATRDSTAGIGLVQLQRRMNQFARSNRVPRVFSQCMEAKGYTRG